MNTADSHIFKGSMVSNANYKCKPGWSDIVEDLHKCARELFVMWQNAGKQKMGNYSSS